MIRTRIFLNLICLVYIVLIAAGLLHSITSQENPAPPSPIASNSATSLITDQVMTVSIEDK